MASSERLAAVSSVCSLSSYKGSHIGSKERVVSRRFVHSWYYYCMHRTICHLFRYLFFLDRFLLAVTWCHTAKEDCARRRISWKDGSIIIITFVDRAEFLLGMRRGTRMEFALVVILRREILVGRRFIERNSHLVYRQVDTVGIDGREG
jgi:hypothetical protein